MVSGKSTARLPAAQRRGQLLVAALELFGARGYHDTSMDDIADGAGVTKPVVYQHFGSKRDLYAGLLSSVGAELTAAVAAAGRAERTPSRRVLAGYRAYFRFVSERTAAFGLLFGTGARGTGDFADVVGDVEYRLAGILADLAGAGSDADAVRVVGFALVGGAETVARRWVLSARGAGTLDEATGQRLAAELSDLLCAGLLRRASISTS